MKRQVSLFLLWLGLALQLSACEPQLSDDPIPLVAFNDIVLNLNLPENSVLRQDGRFLLLKTGGVRGIIVYRVNSTTFHAYERNCSYHPNEAGSTVDIHSSNLYMQDFSCGSTFNFEEGQPTGGPAWRPLQRYHTDVVGNTLTITSDIVDQ